MDLITLALCMKRIGQGIPAAVSGYLDEHLTNPTNPPIDTSLAIAGAAADAKATGDRLSTVKEDLNKSNSRLDKDVGGMLNEWTVGHVTSNGFTTDTRYAYSNVLYSPKGSRLMVNGGGYYFNVFSMNKVADTGIVTADYEYNSTLISGYLSNPVDITIESDTYIIIDCRNGASYSASTNIDISAIPIDAKLYAGLVLGAYKAPIADGSVTKVKTDFWEHIKSANLFDASDSANIVTGYYVKSTDGTLVSNSTYFTAYTKIEGAGDYCLITNTGLYGTSNAKAIHFYDAEKNYLSQVDGTYLDTSVTDRPTKVTVSQTVINNGAVYIGWTGKIAQINDLMVVKASAYPSVYERYADYWDIPDLAYSENPLVSKFASFNGDSICYGVGYTGGYGGIIANKNSMRYQNVGVAGGTITSGTTYEGGGNRYWINAHISDMDADADYAIVEGGVNDSSLQVTLGSITADYDDTLDTDTFYGAMENLCKQLVTRFAGKKYGFIIPHQMSQGLRPNGAYHQAVIACCSKWGVPVLDLSLEVPPFGFFDSDMGDLYTLRQTYTKDGDGWHPNEAGYRDYYVPKIESWMKTL